MSRTKFIIENAKQELQRSNLDKTQFGESVIDFLKSACEISHNEVMLRELIGIVERLAKCEPITEITEQDFENVNLEKIVKKCTRLPYIYQTSDGKYWNDRAVKFLLVDDPCQKELFLYQKNLSSKQEIFLPYYPHIQVKYITSQDIG